MSTDAPTAPQSPETLFLPPRDMWRHDPFKDERIETPVDSRGLVVLGQLIDQVVETVDPEYKWPLVPQSDIHHLYWHREWYPVVHERGQINRSFFRELSVHKALVPRVFHNWIHLVTKPPAVPDPEVMAYRIEAFQLARNLFRRAQAAIRTEREFSRWLASDGYDRCPNDASFEEFWVPRATRVLSGMDTELSALEAVPPEFQLIELNGDSIITIARQLGRVCTMQHENGLRYLRTDRRPLAQLAPAA